jgi:hypothetical protein
VLDTKILANASTRRSATHQKLSERERYWESTVEQLLTEAQRTDEQEDQRFGKGQPADPLPAELANAQSRLERIRRAKAELEQEAQQELEAAKVNHIGKRGRPTKQEQIGRTLLDPQQRDKEKKRLRRARRNADQPTRQYNFVDPDSRVMRDNARKSFVQGYNAQIAVDAHQQVIVAAEITQKTTDREQLLPMVRSVSTTTGRIPERVTADAGYWDTSSLRDPSLQGIQVLVSPDAQVQPPGVLLVANAPNSPEAVRMREVLLSPVGKLFYALRKATVEPVFGQIKEIRGLRRFRFRGLRRVQCEWKLICATHNLLKLFRYRTGLTPA